MTKRTKQDGAAAALLVVVALALAAPAAAGERLIPFQGRVTDGAGEPLNGVFGVTFAIYDTPTGGVALWVERHEEVSVMAGQVNVFLGSRRSLDDPDGNGNPSDAVSFADTLVPRFLGIKVGEETNQEMVPRHELLPSFHARVADRALVATTAEVADLASNADRVTDGGVTRIALNADLQTALVPRNTVIFYDGAVCPDGWTEYTAGRGRAVVGLPLSGTLGGLNNASAYGNQENRLHSHALQSGLLTGTTANDSHNHEWSEFRLGADGYHDIYTFNFFGNKYFYFNWSADGFGTEGGGFNAFGANANQATTSHYTSNDTHNHTAGSLQLSNRNTNSISGGVPTVQLLMCVKNTD